MVEKPKRKHGIVVDRVKLSTRQIDALHKGTIHVQQGTNLMGQPLLLALSWRGR